MYLFSYMGCGIADKHMRVRLAFKSLALGRLHTGAFKIYKHRLLVGALVK